MKKLVLVTFGLLLSTSAIFGQEVNPCGTYEAQQYLFEKFPELKAEYDARMELLQNSVEVTTAADGSKSATYVIPIVFHVLHMYGSENISDANVYALVEELNEDFSATNPGISAVIPEFQGIIGNAQVEFRLAAIDPFGNCTNGIEHIYTHETASGESQIHKVGQWNRARYFNVWVVDEPGPATQGILLGYATFPESTDGSGFWTDGVVLRSTTVAANNNNTLTHEIGHWLGLCHTFGCTGTADDGNCDDDNIPDVPVTDGSFSTCILTRDDCNPGTVENVQNYMDYSSCTHMFSQDQVTVMTNVLNNIAGQRNIIWQDSILEMTGVKDLQLPQTPSNPLSVPLCKPVADFYSPDQITCVGDAVQFEDASWNAVIESRTWTFEGGTPATSTSSMPIVTFDTPGYKKVTLTVTNATGSDTKVMDDYIFVSPNWADFTGPTSLDLNPSNQHYYFVVKNPEDNHGKFEIKDGVGYNQSRAFKLGNYKDISDADPYTEDWFYNMRLGGSVDQLITPSFDLSTTTSVTVSFKFAYATNATDELDMTDVVKVYSSRNCGQTWTPRIASVEGSTVGTSITGADLVSAGFAGNIDFTPTSNSMWRTASFTYTTSSLDTKTRFMIEFTASDLASNLYIDDIMVDGILAVNAETLVDLELEVYPNPTSGEAINVSYMAQNEATEFILRDVQGKIIASEVIEQTNMKVNHTLQGTENLPAAPYFLEVKVGDHSFTKKVVVL